MKIKNPSKKHLLKAKRKASAIHWWLIPERPKKTYRLSQMNKANKKYQRLIGPSEFVKMAIALENA